jgi:hypothetical protein
MIKKRPLLTGKKKPKDDKPNLPIDFGVNYAIAVILAFVSMFKPEISALKSVLK